MRGPNLHSDRRRQMDSAGFSLIEMMIAFALMGIVVAQMTFVLTTQHQNYVEQERASDLQQEVRLLTDALMRDLRMGGFMVPRQVAVGSIDGGNAASDVLCMSDPSVFAPTSYAGATDRFEAPTVTNVMAGSNGSVTLLAGDMDIDGDGTGDFAAGRGIIISDGSRVHCAMISTVAGGVVSFVPPTGAAQSFTTASTLVAPAVVYQVTGTTLTRNGLALSNLAEDLQVEFGVDADGDGEVEAAEFPVNDLTGSDLTRTVLARIHLTSRMAVSDDDFIGGRPAAANRLAGPVDGFRRRKFTTDTLLRNVL